MSTPSVRDRIQTAMKHDASCSNSHVDSTETSTILAEAKKNGVTAGEGKLIGDLYAKGHLRTPGQFATEACPEHPESWYSYDTGSKAKMNTFFVEQNLPYGDNAAKMRTAVIATLDDLDRGTRLSKAPSTRNLHELFIEDKRPVDGTRQDAFIDAKKNTFFLKVTGAGMGGPHTVGPFWYGPFPLTGEKKTDVTQQTRSKILKAFNQASRNGGLQWKSSGMPLGVRYARVPLMRERHPDGYAYTALVPMGALTPTAPAKDPNKATSFFVERTGGIAGWTQIAGPIKL